MLNKLKKHPRTSLAAAGILLVILATAFYLTQKPETTRDYQFDAAYLPDAQLPLGFCTAIDFPDRGKTGQGHAPPAEQLKATANGISAQPVSFIEGGSQGAAVSGYYCFAAPIDRASKKVHYQISYHGDQVLDRTLPLPKPEKPQVRAVRTQSIGPGPHQATGVLLAGFYLHSFPIQVGYQGKWYTADNPTFVPPTKASPMQRGGSNLPVKLPGIWISDQDQPLMQLRYQAKAGWKYLPSFQANRRPCNAKMKLFKKC